MSYLSQVVFAVLITIPVIGAGGILILLLKTRWLSLLQKPIDNNVHLWGEPLFGKNKTWLGVFTMCFFSGLIGGVLWFFSLQLQTQLPFRSIIASFLSFGLIGLTYSLGELPNSFVKRRLHIPAGKLPHRTGRVAAELVDLLDGILAIGLVYVLFFSIPMKVIFISILFGTVVHWSLHKYMFIVGLKSKS